MSSIIEDEGFSIKGEVQEGLLFLHCDVFKETKSVLKRLRDSFEVILDEMGGGDNVAVYSVTPNLRFVKFLGKPFDIVSEENGDYLVAWGV